MVPSTRAASASPAAPTPAPSSTTSSPRRAGHDAASRIASWPKRWPRAGCRSRSLPSSTASSVNWPTPRSPRIRAQLGPEAGISKEPAGGRNLVFRDEHALRQDTDRPFQHAHVLVEHDMRDLGRIEQGPDGRDNNRIIGANEFTHTVSPDAQFIPAGLAYSALDNGPSHSHISDKILGALAA